jgi:hypothetical protein
MRTNPEVRSTQYNRMLKYNIIIPIRFNITVVWILAPCTLVESCERFGGKSLTSIFGVCQVVRLP